jgi:hypothetical protein
MAKKNVDYRMMFEKDDNRNAVATVLKNGNVDANIYINNKNIELIRHFNSIDEAVIELGNMGYVNGVRESVR